MDIITSCKKAFPDVNIPDIKRYYSEHINLWRDIFEMILSIILDTILKKLKAEPE